MLGSRDGTAPVPGQDRRSRRRDRARSDLAELPHDELARLISTLEEEMREAAADLRFEYAAKLRDEIQDLKGELKELLPRLEPDRPGRRARRGSARCANTRMAPSRTSGPMLGRSVSRSPSSRMTRDARSQVR